MSQRPALLTRTLGATSGQDCRRPDKSSSRLRAMNPPVSRFDSDARHCRPTSPAKALPAKRLVAVQQRDIVSFAAAVSFSRKTLVVPVAKGKNDRPNAARYAACDVASRALQGSEMIYETKRLGHQGRSCRPRHTAKSSYPTRAALRRPNFALRVESCVVTRLAVAGVSLTLCIGVGIVYANDCFRPDAPAPATTGSAVVLRFGLPRAGRRYFPPTSKD